MEKVTYNIIRRMGVLSTSASGWQRELNVISWNERDPKYDIRDWSPDGEKMSKGITLTQDEMNRIIEAMNQ